MNLFIRLLLIVIVIVITSSIILLLTTTRTGLLRPDEAPGARSPGEPGEAARSHSAHHSAGRFLKERA